MIHGQIISSNYQVISSNAGEYHPGASEPTRRLQTLSKHGTENSWHNRCRGTSGSLAPCIEGRLHVQTDPAARLVGAAPPTGAKVAIKTQIRFVVA